MTVLKKLKSLLTGRVTTLLCAAFFLLDALSRHLPHVVNSGVQVTAWVVMVFAVALELLATALNTILYLGRHAQDGKFLPVRVDKEEFGDFLEELSARQGFRLFTFLWVAKRMVRLGVNGARESIARLLFKDARGSSKGD